MSTKFLYIIIRTNHGQTKLVMQKYMAWNTRKRRLKWSSNDVGHHRLGERFTDQCVYDSDRIGGGSVVAWVGICQQNVQTGTWRNFSVFDVISGNKLRRF
jgi:hypothetical protein